MLACFDELGFLKWMVDNSSTILTEPTDIVAEVDGDFKSNDIFLDTRSGRVVKRQDYTLSANKSIIKCDGVDEVRLSELPLPCWIRVNGTPFWAEGPQIISATEPLFLFIEMAGEWKSQPVYIRADTQENLLNEVRTERDLRLTASDWTTQPDNGLGDNLRAAWLDYRQQLRDITTNQPNANIETVVWPVPPA